MANLVTAQQRRGSLLVDGTPNVNLRDFVLSIVGAGIARADYPRVVFLCDVESDGQSQVRNMHAWLESYGGASERMKAKRACVSFVHNVLAMTPAALAQHLLASNPNDCHPVFYIRDDSGEINSPSVATWFNYANVIRARINCTIIHVVKRKPMNEMPVEPKNYEHQWSVSEHSIPYRETVNAPIVVHEHASNKDQIWKDKPCSGGPSVYWPALDEAAL
jgi:hypothetical protein